MFSSPLNSFERPNSDSFNLPFEILSHIFSYLRVNDRKNVRLTCSQWYNACNTISLLENEKMVISTDYSGKKLWFDVLMDCPRLRFNLELIIAPQFPPDASVFWQKLGSRVESLKLKFSFQHKEFGGQMMKFCSNLKKLHLLEDHIVQAGDCILNWDELDIAHESLECLILEHCPFISDFHFSRLFDIYPCIKKLELIHTLVNCHKRVDARFYQNTSHFSARSIFSFSCVFANIKSKAENIKTLVFDRISNCGLLDNWFEELTSLSGLKLKELNLSEHPLLTENAFIKFFTYQTGLEHVKIYACQHFSLKCFLHMIRKCSSLKTIRVECSDVSSNFSMSKEIYHALMLLPRLKILKLKGKFFMEEYISVNRVAPVSATAFQCLRELTLKMPAMYFDIFSPKIVLNLSALHLITKPNEKGLTDENLQLIFDKWIHLRSLKLSLDSSVSDFGFTGCKLMSPENQTEDSGISINRLRRLEKLILICTRTTENSITYASFSHFIFPNLRKLKLIRFPTITEQIFLILCQNTPSLRYCEFQKCKIEDEALMKFRKGWKSFYFHQKANSVFYMA